MRRRRPSNRLPINITKRSTKRSKLVATLAVAQHFEITTSKFKAKFEPYKLGGNLPVTR